MISTLSHSDGMWGNFDSDKAIQIWLPYWLNIIENKAGFLRILEDGGSNLPAAEHQPTTPRACSGHPLPSQDVFSIGVRDQFKTRFIDNLFISDNDLFPRLHSSPRLYRDHPLWGKHGFLHFDSYSFWRVTGKFLRDNRSSFSHKFYWKFLANFFPFLSQVFSSNLQGFNFLFPS